MTKEDLLEILTTPFNSNVARSALIEFLNDNAVIPKGENRHPYADVLHKWVEGAQMQTSHNGIFANYGISALSNFPYEYRIKSQEPVYEWLWVLPSTDNPQAIWATIEQMEEEYEMCPWVKTETKRVKQ